MASIAGVVSESCHMVPLKGHHLSPIEGLVTTVCCPLVPTEGHLAPTDILVSTEGHQAPLEGEEQSKVLCEALSFSGLAASLGEVGKLYPYRL